MTDEQKLPTLTATSAHSSFRLRCYSAAWSAECGSTSRFGAERAGLILFSATGPDTSTKSVRSLLYQPDIEAEFKLELDDGPVHLARARFQDKPVTYTAAVSKLAPGAVHLVAMAKIPGLIPNLSGDHLWAELCGPRYSTPLLRQWTGWLKRSMIESGGIVMSEGHNTAAGMLTTTPDQLDEIVSEGVRRGYLRMKA